MKKQKYGLRYAAYCAARGEHGEFKTKEEAENWLKSGDEEGIPEEAKDGLNWIAEIQYVSEVTVVDYKSNYPENEDGKRVNSNGEEWINDDLDWIGDHHYVKIDWEETGSRTQLNEAAPDLLAACQEFVRKCDNGEARSKRSYSQMKQAINKALGK